MARITQEFYCGECKSYFDIRLNMMINHEAHIECPGCKHQHRRCVVDGVVYEKGRYQTDVVEEICPNPATLRKIPLTQRMLEAEKANSWAGRRDGVPIMDSDRMDRWISVAVRERLGDTE